MREPEERQRHFVIRDKKDENYDQPAVRRRGLMREEEDERGEQDEKPRKPRARRTLREREMEEEEEARSLRGGRRRKAMKRADFDDEDDYEDDDDYSRPRAPKIVRIFAWIALVVILFTCGYVATNYFFSWSDKKGGERIGNVYGSGAEITESAATAENAPSNAKYSIYVPDGSSFQTRSIEIKPGGTREEDIQKVLSMYIDSLKETKAMDTAAAVNSVFHGGDWLYVDMTPAFQSSIKKLGKEKAAQVLNGMLNTMRDNFPPIKKIKFYVNSKEITDKTPVDLTGPWEEGR
ncbi:GerMN domain-containing protein [Cloacibacillus sp. An23]|uniref:GerMN domain-containing protein n=1 Tax=Cloacibacillus sp. An23 TaxID=1965591 RepID=UPI000B377259|nr:GerMN domain-containing protein [Cloacibacillus sp. An23]OUO94128.1 hypothetical protein B5F39_05540 [Cloacibacillus sp. An23]